MTFPMLDSDLVGPAAGGSVLLSYEHVIVCVPIVVSEETIQVVLALY